MRHRITDQPGFRFAAQTGRAFVADFAARAGGRAGERRDGGRMIVGFHLGGEVRGLGLRGEHAAARVGVKTHRFGPRQHRGVVAVGDQGTVAMRAVGFPNHVEQRARHHAAVDAPFGVEDFVAAVLGVDLREHHQFDIGRVAAKARELRGEVTQFNSAEREAERGVGFFQRGHRGLEVATVVAAAEQVHHGRGPRAGAPEQRRGRVAVR